MKILHIINNLSSGGAEKLLEQVIPIMNLRDDIHIEVLLLSNKNNVFEESLVNKNIRVKTLILNNIYNPINSFLIRNYILDNKFDIVHAHLFPTNYWVYIANKMIFRNRPYFITTEHSTSNKRRKKKYFKYIEKNVYSSYDKIISISEDTQNNLLHWLDSKNKVNNEKYIIINNGINLKRFENIKPISKKKINLQFNDEVKLLCMVGRFSKSKDQATIIRAMTMLPNNVHLLLIGEGKYKEENMLLSKKLKVDRRIHFLGFRNDIENILNVVDIIILSSNYEGFGLVAVEGMAVGKPVLVSNVPGLNSVIADDFQLFQCGDEKELAEKIKELLNNDNLYQYISKSCKKKSAEYSIYSMVNRYLEEYEKLLTGTKIIHHK